jgi:hypothetical protein
MVIACSQACVYSYVSKGTFLSASFEPYEMTSVLQETRQEHFLGKEGEHAHFFFSY